MRAGWSSWSIDVLPGWEVKDDDECLSIFHPNGIGALQISSAKKSSGNVQQGDLDFHSKPEWGNPKKCVYGEFSGQLYSFTLNENFWCWWVLANGPILLRMTYNCSLEDQSVEQLDVNRMLTTLRREKAHA